MTPFQRLRRWLFNLEYPAVPERLTDVRRGEPTEIVEPAWREGYVVGHAAGEIHGRVELSREIERMFPEHKAPMDAEDAHRIRSRQVH